MEITEHKLKDILTEQRTEYQRFLGVMKEDFDSKVQLIAEQYNIIDGKLSSHAEMVGALMEDVQIIKSDVQFLKGALKKKVDYEEFEALVQRVSLLESKTRK